MTRSCQPSCCQPPKRIFLGVSVHHSDQSEGVWCQQVFRETETLRKATLNLRRLQDSGFQGRVCAGAGGVTSPVRSLGTVRCQVSGTWAGALCSGWQNGGCWRRRSVGRRLSPDLDLDHPLRRLFQRKHISFRRVTGTSSATGKRRAAASEAGGGSALTPRGAAGLHPGAPALVSDSPAVMLPRENSLDPGKVLPVLHCCS